LDTKKLNVLLVDDDLDDCDFFKEALKSLPVSTQLTALHDGNELMNLLTNEQAEIPDVLFLDINMPCKNGLECLIEIKRESKLKEIPVVIYSTSGTQENINTLLNAGASIYIRKPRNFSQIGKVIQNALNMAAENIPSNKQLKYILNA
jgi:CheY-like chemotaxis protein